MFDTKTRQLHRPCESSVRPRLATLVLVGFGALALIAQPAAADVIQEAHAFSFSVENPTPGSTSEYTWDMPLFDTAGGTRTLAGLHVDYHLYSNFTWTMHDNLTPDWHGCEYNWTQTWRSTRDGAPFLPLQQPSGSIPTGAGIGGWIAPYNLGFGPNQGNGGGGGPETSVDAALLATVTGSGTVPVLCTQSLSAMTVSPPHRWPPEAPLNQRVFDPNQIDVHVDSVVMDLTLTYYWTPEPGSLSLLGLLTLLLRRR